MRGAELGNGGVSNCWVWNVPGETGTLSREKFMKQSGIGNGLSPNTYNKLL
jgi:hypothetical protein